MLTTINYVVIEEELMMETDLKMSLFTTVCALLMILAFSLTAVMY